MSKHKHTLFGPKSGMRRIERERVQYRDMADALNSSLRIITALTLKLGGSVVIAKEDLEAVEHSLLSRRTREDGSLEFVVEQNLAQEEVTVAIARQEAPALDAVATLSIEDPSLVEPE